MGMPTVVTAAVALGVFVGAPVVPPRGLGHLDLLEDLLAASLGGDGDPLLPDVDENGGGLYFRLVGSLGQARELCPKPLQFQQVIWVDGTRSFLGRPWKAAAAICSVSSGETVESDIWLETWYLMICVWNEAKSGQTELWKENLKPLYSGRGVSPWTMMLRKAGMEVLLTPLTWGSKVYSS